MEIDIIDLSKSEYSGLTSAQMQEVCLAQAEKDKAVKNATLEKRAILQKLVDNDYVRSTVLYAEEERIDRETEEKIDFLKTNLIYRIAAMKTEEITSYPYNPDYSLTKSERFNVVRDYYVNKITDPNARLNAFSADLLARDYLGEYYQTLYTLLASYK